MLNWSLGRKLQVSGAVLSFTGLAFVVYHFVDPASTDDFKIGLAVWFVGTVVLAVGCIIVPTKQGIPIICPNTHCDYKGASRAIPRGYTLIGVALLFFMLLPGVFYFMLLGGYRYRCPKCGLEVARDG